MTKKGRKIPTASMGKNPVTPSLNKLLNVAF